MFPWKELQFSLPGANALGFPTTATCRTASCLLLKRLPSVMRAKFGPHTSNRGNCQRLFERSALPRPQVKLNSAVANVSCYQEKLAGSVGFLYTFFSPCRNYSLKSTTCRRGTVLANSIGYQPTTWRSNMQMKKILMPALSVVALTIASVAAHATPVISNNVTPGDAFTNAGGANQGQAVGATGWYYNNVRNSGTAGINNTYARSGNGSALLQGTVGPGGASSKADIEYLSGGVAVGGNYFATTSMGLFSTFSGMQYDWYRNSASTNSGVQIPALRILLDLDGNLATTGDRGGLVYEWAYNEAGNATTDTWVTANVGASTKLWNFGLGLGFEFDIDGDGSPYDTLAEWQASARLGNAAILGFSAGVGSGWGPFVGAVDNIGWTINGQSQTSNFEVAGAAVPEPGTMMLVGAALLGLAAARRRRG